MTGDIGPKAKGPKNKFGGAKHLRGREVKPEKVKDIVIDAAGCTLGRLAAFAAKEALKGNNVIIFNAEAALISGKRDNVFADYKNKFDAKSGNNPMRFGPKRPRNPDRFVRRVIRGMLPWGQPRGRKAFARVLVYTGKPVEEIKKRHKVDITVAPLADVSQIRKKYDWFVTVGELCEFLGGKV